LGITPQQRDYLSDVMKKTPVEERGKALLNSLSNDQRSRWSRRAQNNNSGSAPAK